MWVEVEFTHCRGVKIARGKQHPSGKLRGELTTARTGPALFVQLKPSRHDEAAALLWAPHVVGFALDVFQIAGLERDGRAWVRQHWICRLEQRPDFDLPRRRGTI
jgi:hypothetical protein